MVGVLPQLSTRASVVIAVTLVLVGVLLALVVGYHAVRGVRVPHVTMQARPVPAPPSPLAPAPQSPR